MPEIQDAQKLPNAPEEKLLPHPEDLPALAPVDTLLEIMPPDEILLLTSQPPGDVPTIISVPPMDRDTIITSSYSENTHIDITDPTLFDTIGMDRDVESMGPDNELTPHAPIAQQVQSQENTIIQSPILPSSPLVASTAIVDIATHSTPMPLQNTIQELSDSEVSYKKYVFIGVFLCICVIVGGAIFLMSQQSRSKEIDIAYTLSAEPIIESYETTVSAMITADENDIDLMNRASKENDPSLCVRIVSDSRKDECTQSLLARAITSSGSLQECDTLTLPDIRENCRSVLIQENAIKSLDKSICSTMDDPTQTQYCIELVDQEHLTQMTQSGLLTESMCAGLIEKYRQQCLQSINRIDDTTILQTAVTDENLDTCKALSTDELQFTCFDTILLKQALKSGDRNLCDYVHDEAKKNTCLSYMSKQDDNTLFKTAIVEKNLNMCQDITVDTLRNRCHDSVTLLLVRDTKDIKLCDTLIATGSLDACKKSTGVQ